jgi:predicted DNA-binding transcriptional regulator YafY
VRGEAQRDGPDGSFAVPEGTDLRALTAALAPEPASRVATLRVRDGAAHALRRRATASRAEPDGWSVLEVPFGRDDAIADEVLGHGADVVVLAPAELRELVLRRLRALAQPSGASR